MCRQQWYLNEAFSEFKPVFVKLKSVRLVGSYGTSTPYRLFSQSETAQGKVTVF